MMNSVEPPPISTTSRLPWQAGASRGAQVDQSRLFPAGNDFDGEPKRRLGLDQELRGILGHAQRICRHGAYLVGREVAQAVTEASQGLDTAAAGRLIQILVGSQAGGQANRLTERVDLEDLAGGAGSRGVSSTRPIIRRKLLEPMSTAASKRGVCVIASVKRELGSGEPNP
jgi:hypothetical protein